MEDSLAFHYYFTHKSGRKMIAQTSSEFYHMQGYKSTDSKIPAYMKSDKGEFERDYWGSQQVRLGYKEWRGFPSKEQHDAEEKMNKIWELCKGHEKLFNSASNPKMSRLHTGYYGCGMRRFVAELENHAIMMGDEELYKKTKDGVLRGNMLCLPYRVNLAS